MCSQNSATELSAGVATGLKLSFRNTKSCRMSGTLGWHILVERVTSYKHLKSFRKSEMFKAGDELGLAFL